MASNNSNNARVLDQDSVIQSTSIIRGKQLPADFWCTTKMRTVKVSYMWTIKDFNSLISKEVDSVFTQCFSAKDTPHVIWRLILKIGPNDKEDIEVELRHEKSSCLCPYRVCLKAQISILNAESEKHQDIAIFEGLSGEGDKWNSEEFFSKAVLMENPDDLLPKNALTVFCEISQSGYFNIQKEKNITIYADGMSDDFSKFFENYTFADVSIVVQGTAFKVHKLILAARCPVFWAMFKPESKTKEEITGIVEVEDIEPKVFRELLRYIYTGEIESINDDTACALLIAADKYGLESLKLICENTLYDIMTVKNAMHILVTVNQLEMYHLKQKVLKFIKSNLTDVMKSKSWNEAVNTHVDLLTEIMKLHISE